MELFAPDQMSALGQKQTYAAQNAMSALGQKADIAFNQLAGERAWTG
jgi:hypothetical protein